MYTKPPVSTAAGTVLDGQEILIPKTPPAVLGLDGRKAYRDLRADYGYLYSPADLPALTSYCSAYDLVALAILVELGCRDCIFERMRDFKSWAQFMFANNVQGCSQEPGPGCDENKVQGPEILLQ